MMLIHTERCSHIRESYRQELIMLQKFRRAKVLGKLPELTDVQKAVFSLQDAICHNKTLSQSLDAIAKLTSKSEENKYELHLYGGFSLLINILVNTMDENICGKVIRVLIQIGFIPTPPNLTSLPSRESTKITSDIKPMLQDLCQALMSALNRFPSHDQVCIAVNSAFWNIVVVFDSTSDHSDIISFGVCESIVATLSRLSRSSDTVYESCFAMTVIASWNVMYKHRFGDVGACSLLPSILREFINDHRICSVVCEAIGVLCYEHIQNQINFCEYGIIERLIDVIDYHAEELILLWFISHIFESLILYVSYNPSHSSNTSSIDKYNNNYTNHNSIGTSTYSYTTNTNTTTTTTMPSTTPTLRTDSSNNVMSRTVHTVAPWSTSLNPVSRYSVPSRVHSSCSLN